ncbi:hypothetical protein [Mucilaginibacter gotjawali]|uniref:Uncharacterized protein n=1 Tax=Mucilaginibacter gotjawali TaxID=1550579 RepID=A0A839SFH1_9SPHI|nr:hypothetical protein [Mucilaginibacter gotjawali]MBB3055287.1 hypothetical protein [Mucilaginibacter gotjawali]
MSRKRGPLSTRRETPAFQKSKVLPVNNTPYPVFNTPYAVGENTKQRRNQYNFPPAQLCPANPHYNA